MQYVNGRLGWVRSISSILALSAAVGCFAPPSSNSDKSSSGSSSNSESLNSLNGIRHSLYVSEFFKDLRVAGENGNLAVDSQGNIYYPAPNENVIRKIDTSGVQTVFAGSGTIAYADGTGTLASFYAPRLITIDSNDNLYMADGFKIRKITSNAVVTTVASMPTGGSPRGIAADANGNFYFVWDDSAASTHVIKKIAPDGTISTYAGSGSAGNANGSAAVAEFRYPQDLVVDSSGNLFVADAGNYLIRKITPSGVVSTFAGSGTREIQDGAGTDASFYFYDYTTHMAIDSSDNIYLGDITGIEASSMYTIRRISPQGEVASICGAEKSTALRTGKCSDASPLSRFGVAIGPDGTIYNADTSIIYKISKRGQ